MRTVNRFLVSLFLTAAPGVGRAAVSLPAAAGDMVVLAGGAVDSARTTGAGVDSARTVMPAPGLKMPNKLANVRSHAGADSGRVVVRRSAPDTTKGAPGVPAVPWHRRPRYIMFRSIVVPGWGQWANGRHVKAAVVALGEGYLLYRAVDYGRQERAKLREAAAATDPTIRAELTGRHQVLAAHRRDFTWWSVFAGLLSMGDAYVDAQLGNFDAEFKPQDTASAGDAPGWRAAVTFRW